MILHFSIPCFGVTGLCYRARHISCSLAFVLRRDSEAMTVGGFHICTGAVNRVKWPKVSFQCLPQLGVLAPTRLVKSMRANGGYDGLCTSSRLGSHWALEGGSIIKQEGATVQERSSHSS